MLPPCVMNVKHHCHSSSVNSEKPNVLLTICSMSSAVKPPPKAIVTKNCSSTSKVNTIGSRRSMVWVLTASFSAATSINSKECVGTKYIFETSKGECPLRPARCIKRATPLLEPICITVSTGLKSTPKSSEEVETRSEE